MNKIYRILIIVILASIIPACTENEEVFGPVLEIYGGQQTLAFSNYDGFQSMMINTNRDFTLQSSQPWCSAEILPDEIINLSVSVTESEIIGKNRSATITVSSEGLDDLVIDVIQDGIPAIINSSQASVVLEDGESTFSLTITTNILVDFMLPDWIHLQANNTPEVGGKTYHFDIDAIADGEVRTENIIVKAADIEINKSISIPITQGKELGPFQMVVEAESTITADELTDPGFNGTRIVLWSNNVNTPDFAEYNVTVPEEGAYNFTLKMLNWGNPAVVPLSLEVNGVDQGTADVPAAGGDVIFTGINLNSGVNTIKFSTGVIPAGRNAVSLPFDSFTITAQ